MKLLNCPNQLNDHNSIRFINELDSLKDDIDDLYIDFSSIKFATPFATMILAEYIRSFVAYRYSIKKKVIANEDNYECNQGFNYLKHMGFFRHIGADYGNTPNENEGNTKYIPIRVVNKNSLIGFKKDLILQEKIIEESDRLASILFDDDLNIIQTSYCFREIIRNVFEHAETDNCIIMAQKYKYYLGEEVEMVIIDDGCGIYTSLKNNYLEEEDVESTIIKAMKPGISKTMRMFTEEHFANSGFGLYIISRLAQELGEFRIFSNGIIINFVNNNYREVSNIILQGTGIKLRINTSNAEYFPNLLEKIVLEGEKEFEEETGLTIKASSSSKSK